jgi:hypothetical protein
MRVLVMIIVIVTIAGLGRAQTETPTLSPSATPSVTPTPTPETGIYATIAAPDGTPVGISSRLDIVATAGDVHIANLLTAIFLSMWAMFVYAVWVVRGRR